MIPIECPKCGRRGNVPPDRLNSRLHCKACDAVFHLDHSGHLVLGEPGQPGKKPKERSRAQTSSAVMDFDLKGAWDNIPTLWKLAIPGVVVGLLAWQVILNGEGGTPGHLGRSEAIGRALVANDKGRVQSAATAETAEAAGRWFDLMRERIAKEKVGPDAYVAPSLFSGNAEGGSSVVIQLTISGGPGSAPLSPTLYLNRAGNSWVLDGKQTLADAEKATPSAGAARKK